MIYYCDSLFPYHNLSEDLFVQNHAEVAIGNNKVIIFFILLSLIWYWI